MASQLLDGQGRTRENFHHGTTSDSCRQYELLEV